MSWVSAELFDVDLGDVRRQLRLMGVVEALAEHCEESFPKAFGSWAAVKAAYRLWENSRIPWQNILQPHCARAVQRAGDHPVILAIQDTTEINLTSHPATTGLGYLGAAYCRGLLMHSVLATTPQGQVLGLLHLQLWARPLAELGQSRQRHQRVTHQKESQRWIDGLAATSSALAAHAQVIVVGDREADFYDFFVALAACERRHFGARDPLLAPAAGPRHQRSTSASGASGSRSLDGGASVRRGTPGTASPAEHSLFACRLPAAASALPQRFVAVP